LSIQLRLATSDDLPEILALLGDSKLPVAGVREALSHFIVAYRADRLVGVVGFEAYGRYALLRSAAVRSSEQGSGLGRALVEQLLAEAERNGVRELYLLTTTAQRWFVRFGFEEVARDDVPEAVRRSVEFNGACPETAVVMRRQVRGESRPGMTEDRRASS
jgi:amino-acid N-acetyltransferase